MEHISPFQRESYQDSGRNISQMGERRKLKILVAGATPITVAGDLNLQIIRDAAKAIVAAGGPRLGRRNIVLFGEQA